MTMIFRPNLVNAGPAGEVHVSMSEGSDGSDILDGRFSVSASTETVWAVLTDYDGMAAFVSSIKSSRVVKQEKDFTVVEQVMRGKAGIFRKRVHLTLEVKETPPYRIVFRDTSKKSFKFYEGLWEVLEEGDRLNITYHLRAKPDFFSPDFLAKKAFKNTVKVLLMEVLDEIAVRARPPE